MKKEDIFLGSALIATLAAVWLVWPFADAILWGMFTAYFLHYFADRLDTHIQNRTITTGLMILILVGFVAAISLMVITSLNAEQVDTVTGQFSLILTQTVDHLVRFFDLPPALGADMKETIRGFTTLSSDRIIQMVSEIPMLLINILVYFMVAAFLVKDGKKMKSQLFQVIGSLPEEYQSVTVSVVTSIERLFRGVFLTYLVVSLAVGTLATAGFYALGVNFYWFWGLLITIFAFFPVVSAPMVYGPLALLYISIGAYWTGVIILAYGVLVLNTLPEVLFRPYMAAHQTKEHPLLLFVGFIIGPLVLGLKGVILGPMILVVTKNLLSMKYFEDIPEEALSAESAPTTT